MPRAARRAGSALAFALVLLATAPPQAVAQAPDPWAICTAHARAASEAEGLPRHLLGAIARVESGRWNGEREAVLAWPWTIRAEGKGRYLPSRPAAVAAVRALQARGVDNIDVGCMQINLRYHGQAFANLEEALDPASNTAYAADFLARLRAETGSWTTAIGRYHSRTPRLSGPYRLKVCRAWREARRAPVQARRAQPAPAKGRNAPAPGQMAARPAAGPAPEARR